MLQIFKHRSDFETNQPHPKYIHNLRKDIARVKPILKEKGVNC